MIQADFGEGVQGGFFVSGTGTDKVGLVVPLHVSGSDITLNFDLGASGKVIGTGTVGTTPATCSGEMQGTLTGPADGDSGVWYGKAASAFAWPEGEEPDTSMVLASVHSVVATYNDGSPAFSGAMMAGDASGKELNWQSAFNASGLLIPAATTQETAPEPLAMAVGVDIELGERVISGGHSYAPDGSTFTYSNSLCYSDGHCEGDLIGPTGLSGSFRSDKTTLSFTGSSDAKLDSKSAAYDGLSFAVATPDGSYQGAFTVDFASQ
jgi:hypothetical protein